jgi:predicted component of type VI protein secretion system
MGEHDDLLHRHQPGLKYDSMEQYFCDSAAEWTSNPGNELRRVDGPHAPGELLASGATLTLEHLAATHYADGKEVRDDDRIGDPRKNYREQYVALRAAHPELRNRMYGHAVEANGRLWLQYWFFYFYNDYNLALGIGLHEGDWEMVQLRMHDGAPDLAVYAQHRQAEKRPWAQVTKVPGDPNKKYREHYEALRAKRPHLRNRMYGHAVEAGGHLWLQYWFFYFYNDYNLALGIGLHEGDWEMVQLRIHDGAPDLAVYAQHRQAEKRPWAQVIKLPGDPNRPMVYVARGSHASYFEPGFHQTEAWYDLADG